jgi:hypothetical protein
MSIAQNLGPAIYKNMLLTDQWFKFQTIEKANAIRYYWIFLEKNLRT